jgi:predicted HTH transcriptional regulator
MLEQLLRKEEGKTLEFKENTQPLIKIVQTVVAFANTAGGIIVVGIKDKTKEIIGLENILKDEEKITSSITDSISPLLIPNIQFYTWRNRDILIISVAHSFGPYYLKSQGLDNGVYVRFGSTNRLADKQTITEIQRLKEHKYFDEQPNFKCPIENIALDQAKDLFANISKKFTEQTARTLDLIVPYQEKHFPSNGAVLLFGKDHRSFFPDAVIKLGRFAGTTKTTIIDQQELDIPISIALNAILVFIARHTSTAAFITKTTRKNIPEYPHIVIREAVVNALLHADYSIKGASIQIAIFDDRIEITNPGALPFGLSLETALSGVSQLRNRVIGHVFRELNLIEQWGSGFGRMLTTCAELGISPPKFEELGNFFRITLFRNKKHVSIAEYWQRSLIEYLHENQTITAKKAQKLWKVTSRTTSSRLKKMCKQGMIVEISTSPFDPQKKFSLYNYTRTT